MIQTILVALLVLAAAVYIGRRAWRTIRPNAEPGAAAPGCAGCGSNAANAGLTDAPSSTRASGR